MRDYSSILSEDQAITTGTAQSTNYYVLNSSPNSPIAGARDIGTGSILYVDFEVTEAFNQLLTTLDVILVVSPTTSMTDTDAIQLCSKRILGAKLAQGARWHLPIPPISMSDALNVSLASIFPGVTNSFGLLYTVTGTAFSTGKVTASITPHLSPTGAFTVLGGRIPPKTYPGRY